MAERVLTFERAGRAFSLAATQVSEIAADRPLESVPLAPSAIAGLTLERGRLLTVIELDRLLRIRAEPDGGTYLVVLARPFEHLALRVRADLRLEDAGAREPHPEPIEVSRMVQAIEAVLATAGHAALERP